MNQSRSERLKEVVHWLDMTLNSARVRGFASYGYGDVMFAGGFYFLADHPGNKHNIGTEHPHDNGPNGTSEKLHKILYSGTRDEVYYIMLLGYLSPIA